MEKYKKLILTIIGIFISLIIIFSAFIYHQVNKAVDLMDKTDKSEIETMTNANVENVLNELKEQDLEKYKQYTSSLKENWTVAIFGVDSRNQEEIKQGNSDVIMIASVNNKTGDIKLVSVYRDTCLKVGDIYRKANYSYAVGGPKKALEMLNENLDLQIDDYITVNWDSVATAINILGGIDMELSKSELKYINGYITETVNSTKIGSTQFKEEGMNHFDGIQAVAYARIRYTDDDFHRTERQRKVLNLTLQKSKKADFKTIYQLVYAVLPNISSSISTNDILYLGQNVFKYNIKDTKGFPFEKIIGTKNGGDYVFPKSLIKNVSELHEFLYGQIDYIPSKAVQKIDNTITNKNSSRPQRKTVKPTEQTEQAESAKQLDETVETTKPVEIDKNIIETETIDEQTNIIINKTKPTKQYNEPNDVILDKQNQTEIQETISTQEASTIQE